MADTGVFGRYKGFNEFQQEAKKNNLAEALAGAQIQAAQAKMAKSAAGGDSPAAIQIVNEMEKARSEGNVDRYNLLHQVSKSFAIDRGMNPEWSGYAAPQSVPAATTAEPFIPPKSSPSDVDFGEVAPNMTRAFQNPAQGSGDFLETLAPQTAATPPQVIPGYAEAASSLAAAKTSASEQAKKNVQLEMDPLITAATERAKPSGKALGEADADFNSRLSRQPQLNSVAKRLSALGKLSTYTVAGKARDSLVRELGRDVPDAAVGRTEYISMVDNEVLPLLRETFGSQFTEREGASLKTTLGDPNKSPEEKDAVLRSFIRSKMETVNSLARQTDKPEPYQSKDVEKAVGSIGTAPVAPKGSKFEIDFKLKKAGFTPQQIKEYKAAKGL